MVTVFVESLVREPPLPIISSEPFSIVSVPVVSVNGVSNVTITFPSRIISSEPVGSMPLLQFDASDQTPVAPPTQALGGEGVTRPQEALVIAFPVRRPVSVMVGVASVQLTIEPRFVVIPALMNWPAMNRLP